jgi:hypothetical protein
MEEQPINKSDLLSDALRLIDPSGTLVPGSREYDTVNCMIKDWIDQNGADRALCMARMCRKRLGRWLKLL